MMKERSLRHDIAASRAKSLVLLRAALSKKAFDPVLIRLSHLTSVADFFLIVSGGSAKQVKAIAEAVLEEGKRSGFERISAEGVTQGGWALLDYGDVIAHVFQPTVRDFYDLEGLWSEAPRESFPEDIRKEIEESLSARDDDFDDF